MKKVCKHILATSVAFMLSTGVAWAFGGLSVGVYGAVGDFNTAGQENDLDRLGTRDTANTSTSVSESVEFGGVFAEVTSGDIGLGWTVGLDWIPHDAEIGAKTRTDSSTAETPANSDDGTYSARAQVEDHLSVYVEPTWMFNDSVGLYVKGAINRVRLNTLEAIGIGEDSSAYGNINVFGASYGIGFKAASPIGLFLKVEGVKTEYETFSLNSENSTAGNVKSIDVTDMESKLARIAIGFNF